MTEYQIDALVQEVIDGKEPQNYAINLLGRLWWKEPTDYLQRCIDELHKIPCTYPAQWQTGKGLNYKQEPHWVKDSQNQYGY